MATDIISVATMRLSDAATIESGISGRELMRRAAEGIYRSVDWVSPVAIVCGSGNNAGDGYALALLLNADGYDCCIITLSDRFSDDGRYYYDRCREQDIPVLKAEVNHTGNFLDGYAIIVDCILGTGFSGDVREDIAGVIDLINSSKAYVVSVDINSGLNGDNGMAAKCVISDITVSIGSFKPGHFLNMAKDVMKHKTNVDIGITPLKREYSLIDREDIRSSFPPRKNFSNKGSYGYIALIGGSKRYSGAVRLAYMAGAAMRSGAGVVRVALPESLYHDVATHILESTIFPLSDTGGEIEFVRTEADELIHGLRCIAFGMGIGTGEGARSFLKYLLENYKGRLIVDADGLTLLAQMDEEAVRDSACELILTPHPGEFARLTGKAVPDILVSEPDIAVKYAKRMNVILLLKGASTMITDGDRTYITDAGCAGMATAGSGDVLSGVLAAVCGYMEDPLMAVAAGAYIAGRAGEAAQDRYGAVSMLSGDTVGCIPEVIMDILSDLHDIKNIAMDMTGN